MGKENYIQKIILKLSNKLTSFIFKTLFSLKVHLYILSDFLYTFVISNIDMFSMPKPDMMCYGYLSSPI